MTHDQACEGTHVRCDNCEGVDPASCINAGPKREGTPVWEQPELIEKAGRALASDDGVPWEATNGVHKARYLAQARAMLAAVGPMIAAQTLHTVHDEVVDELGVRFHHAWQVSSYMAERADQIAREDADR